VIAVLDCEAGLAVGGKYLERLWFDGPGGVGVRASMVHGPLFPLKLPRTGHVDEASALRTVPPSGSHDVSLLTTRNGWRNNALAVACVTSGPGSTCLDSTSTPSHREDYAQDQIAILPSDGQMKCNQDTFPSTASH